MKSTFLQQAYWDIAGDWPKALQLALVPWLLTKLCVFGSNFFYFENAWVSNAAVAALPDDSSYHITSLILFVAEVGVAVWIAVAWHRYILLKELPSGHLPKWFGKLNWQYLIRLIYVSLISVVPFFALFLIYSQTFGSAPDFSRIPFESGATLVAMLTFLFFGCASGTYLMLRIGVILPAVAVQTTAGIKYAWRLTKTANSEIAGCSAVIGLAVTAITVASYLFSSFDAVILVLSVLAGFTSLLSLSLLTAIYDQLTEDN